MPFRFRLAGLGAGGVVIRREEFQRGESSIVVAVDDPHGAAPGQGLGDEQGVHDMDAVRVAPDHVPEVGLGAESGIEGDDGILAAVPVFRERPVYLHVRFAECVDVALHVGGAGLGPPVSVGEIVPEEVAQGRGVAAGAGVPGRGVAHARTRCGEQVGEHVFLVVAVARRGADGVVDFGEVFVLQGQVGEDLGDVRQGEQPVSRGRGKVSRLLVAGRKGQGRQEQARKEKFVRFHVCIGLVRCKVTENYPFSPPVKRLFFRKRLFRVRKRVRAGFRPIAENG